jgi:hypothetical protein
MIDAIRTYNNRAEIFRLSEDLARSPAPTRMYRAQIRNAWTNDSGNENGYYVDVRKGVK